MCSVGHQVCALNSHYQIIQHAAGYNPGLHGEIRLLLTKVLQEVLQSIEGLGDVPSLRVVQCRQVSQQQRHQLRAVFTDLRLCGGGESEYSRSTDDVVILTTR